MKRGKERRREEGRKAGRKEERKKEEREEGKREEGGRVKDIMKHWEFSQKTNSGIHFFKPSQTQPLLLNLLLTFVSTQALPVTLL